MTIRALFAAVLLLSGMAVHAQKPAPTSAATGNESRLALVIGNSSYSDAPLANPVNDANAIAKTLQSLGFKVMLRTNVSQSQMRQAVREFGDALHSQRGVGLFYFAGHGMQINSRNFLIPVGTDIRREYEIEDQSVDAGSVLAMMQSAKARVNIVILDACRNNPFARSFRSGTVGLAPMQAPAGTLLAFATAPGEVASDGSGANGLYTQHLLQNLTTPGLKIEDVFKNVRASVRRDSGNRQTPWENTSLEGDFYFQLSVTVNVNVAPASVSRTEVESAVQAALSKRDQDEATRRRTQQEEIERAVQAALKKREAEAAAAQTAKPDQGSQSARAAIERLTQELAELRTARQATEQTATKPLATQATRPAPKPATITATTAPAAQIALATPTTRPAPEFTLGQSVDKPDIRVGDQWQYQVTDTLTGIKRNILVDVQTVTENRIYTQNATVNVAAAGAPSYGALYVWDRNWNPMREGSTEYNPFYPMLQFPLEPGKKWSGNMVHDVPQGTIRTQLTAQVAGWEKVTVPAGTFDTIKILATGYWNESRADGPIRDTIWYAPAVRNIVRREIDRRHQSSRARSSDQLDDQSQRERWELVEFGAQ